MSHVIRKPVYANCKSEDQWSCKRSPDTWSWYMFNAFIHVYSPRAGADNPLGTNNDVNRKPLSLCPFVASFKRISLKYAFKHSLNYFVNVYSPRAETDNPLGTKFWCQQKFLITLPVCCQLKKISLKSDFLPFFMFLFFFFFFLFCFHLYIAPDKGRQPIEDKNSMTTERAFLFVHMLQVSKWSLRNLILYTFSMILYMYKAPGQRHKILGDNVFLCQQKALVTSTICCKFQTNLFEFWFYTHFFFNVFHMYIALGQGQTLWTKVWCP